MGAQIRARHQKLNLALHVLGNTHSGIFNSVLNPFSVTCVCFTVTNQKVILGIFNQLCRIFFNNASFKGEMSPFFLTK